MQQLGIVQHSAKCETVSSLSSHLGHALDSQINCVEVFVETTVSRDNYNQAPYHGEKVLCNSVNCY